MVAECGHAAPSGYLYLLHFRSALATGRKASRHYVGYSQRWVWRIWQHRAGRGARLLAVCMERDIPWDVAVVCRCITWRGRDYTGRDMERLLKRTRHHARWCPRCGSVRLVDYRDVRPE